MKVSKLFQILTPRINNKEKFVVTPSGKDVPSDKKITIISDPMITYYGFVDAFNIAKKQDKCILGKYDNVSYKFYVVDVA